jgi:1-deoxy-D-xylulose-5-phosphate reductoisomerase
MKKEIVILGSTGSIGRSTLSIIKKDKKNFKIILLVANNNYKRLIKQAIEFSPKNVLIKNVKHYAIVKKKLKGKKIKVFSGNTPLNSIIKKKIDYTISAIVGIAGLQPTLDAIKISKNLAIANKETIICGWEIITKLIKKYKTNLIPIDSEHFSIMELTKNLKDNDIEEIIITASGGPFLSTPSKKLNNVTPNQATKHPNWKMGKKISVDSANMMNKVFELIEAIKLFNFDKKKYKIMIHPQSYVHSIVRLKNGLIKMILYNTDMKIPISNILYSGKNIYSKKTAISHKDLNENTFKKVDEKKFPSTKLISKCFSCGPSTPIIVNASNEVLVNLFLNRKIGFLDIVGSLNKIFNQKDFKKYAKRKVKSVNDIKITDKWARLKTMDMCVK